MNVWVLAPHVELHWILCTSSQTFNFIIVRSRCHKQKIAADKNKEEHSLPMSIERELRKECAPAADPVDDYFQASYVACPMLQNPAPLQVISTC